MSNEPQPATPTLATPTFPWVGTSIASLLCMLVFNSLVWVVAVVNAGWEGPNTEFGLFAGKCAYVLLTPMWLLVSVIGAFPAFATTIMLESVLITYLFYYIHRLRFRDS